MVIGEERKDVTHRLLIPDSILEGPFWPERVRVISSRNIGSKVEVSCVGLNSNRFYSNILTEKDLAKACRMIEENLLTASALLLSRRSTLLQ